MGYPGERICPEQRKRFFRPCSYIGSGGLACYTADRCGLRPLQLMRNFFRRLVNRRATAMFAAGLLFAAIGGGLVYAPIFGGEASLKRVSAEISYSEFRRLLSQKEIASGSLNGGTLYLRTTQGHELTTRIPANTEPEATERMLEAGAEISVAPETPDIRQTVTNIVLGVLFIGFALLVMARSGMNPLAAGRTRATLVGRVTNVVSFADVAGSDEAKSELTQLVQFLKDPNRFSRLGGRIPKGVLLSGPPGTGKTLLARAVAGEAGVPFFSDSGSTFTEMFVGVGSARVRDLFKRAKRQAPCIVFIDEIDAMGGERGRSRSHGEDDKTLNQLLVEMDGFDPNAGVIVIAATNRPELLDSALLRPGRFDRYVVVSTPDLSGRRSILDVHTRKLKLGPDVDLERVARGTPGFSGAELANLANEAALLAAGSGRTAIDMSCFEQAKDKVLMGGERNSLVLSDSERRLTAYHEAGHALVALHSPESDPIHKATIMPRGRALGMVVRLPDGDHFSLTRAKLEAELAVAMGGRVAEEMVMGPSGITTGAAVDIKQATRIARRMVVEWGMSEALGALAYVDSEAGIEPQGATARIIDEEIKCIVDAAKRRAWHILESHRQELDAVASALLERETLTLSDIQALTVDANRAS